MMTVQIKSNVSLTILKSNDMWHIIGFTCQYGWGQGINRGTCSQQQIHIYKLDSWATNTCCILLYIKMYPCPKITQEKYRDHRLARELFQRVRSPLTPALYHRIHMQNSVHSFGFSRGRLTVRSWEMLNLHNCRQSLFALWVVSKKPQHLFFRIPHEQQRVQLHRHSKLFSAYTCIGMWWKLRARVRNFTV